MSFSSQTGSSQTGFSSFFCLRWQFRNLFGIFLLVLAGNLACFSPCLAIDSPSERLASPQAEKRAEALGRQLRCLVCQNESIEDSSAILARDLRHIVREKIEHGASDREILHWMTDRYGSFIRLRPEFSPATALLWLMPVLALGIGLYFALHLWEIPLWKRNRFGQSITAPAQSDSMPPPLSPEETQRLDKLLSAPSSVSASIREHKS